MSGSKRAAQRPVARRRKRAKLKAEPAPVGHGAQAPLRLIGKAEILEITGVTFPTIWSWMRKGQFPRCYVIGRSSNAKSAWRSDDIAKWLAALPVRPLKGDAPDQTTTP
jgi:predicted DNA-binding transcriptional regulator AlpA